uniref:bis(5'-adenosyl)-triphosphatase n=1 Tax=Daphnia galeata TaxID=27404 RepID=A0A8J2RXW0_9CRUS|nr:unnamed protein product [Daphnia galeata]
MNPARQIAVAIISATVLLLCSGPVAGRFGQHDGDGDMGEELGFHPIVDPYKRELDFRVKRATPPEDTTSQKNQVICMRVSPSLPLPNSNANFTFGQATIHGWAVFYKSQHSMAFVKPKCVVPGHVLVMPLKSRKRILDMQSDELADLFLTSQRVQRGMELFHGVSSSMIAVQDGPDAGQSVQHVHVHIMPRRSKDFEENDEIYEELNNHDKGPAVQWRTKKEMMIEADELRQFF